MATLAPHHVDIFPWTAWKASSTYTLSRNTWTGYLGLGVLSMTAGGATGKHVEWDVALDAGTWTLTAIRYQYTSYGIVTPSLGGVDLATSDWYGVNTPNLVTQWTGITVAAAGVFELKFRTDSKRAAATDYDSALHLITLTRTGA